MKRRLRAPSPAFVISLIAVFVALGGTTYAAMSLPKNSVGTRQLRKNAVSSSKIKARAVTAAKINTKGLVVPSALHATSADSATNATSATHATSADSATNATSATHASTADSATNSGQLGGLAASAYQHRVSGTCQTAVSSVNQDGSVGCAKGVVMPIDLVLPSPDLRLISIGDLEIEFRCNFLGQGDTEVVFINEDAIEPATLNWFFWNLTAPAAGGAALDSGGGNQIFGYHAGRIEGQFIYSIPRQEVITVNLHVIESVSGGFCEVNGTAEYAPE